MSNTVYKKYIYKNHELIYKINKENGIWVSTLDSYNFDMDSIIFSDVNKERSEETMIDWFKKVVDEDKVKNYMSKDYSIKPCFEDILYSVRDMPIGYHISLTINREGILHHGLVPNGCKDMTVLKASNIMDSIKPKRIPDWVKRSNAVYVHPNMENYNLASKDYKNCDIYVASLNPSLCWVGSIGLGGFCLFDEDFTSEEEKAHRYHVKMYGQLYWKYSCSLKDFIKNTPLVKKKDSHYGLDEILVMHPIKPGNVNLIGYWDENGVFHKTNQFKDYVKPQFLNDYKKILDAYIY